MMVNFRHIRIKGFFCVYDILEVKILILAVGTFINIFVLFCILGVQMQNA